MVTEADQQDFSALIERHAGILRKVATTYCRDADDRADLAQDILAQLWAAWPRYDRSRPFSTWMYRVALNVAISHLRGVYRNRRHIVPMGPEHLNIQDRAAQSDGGPQRLALETLVASLDPLNRALLLLYLDERSHREIGEILGLSETNVGTRIGRLKQRIRGKAG